MSRLRVRPGPADASGKVIDVTPESAGWQHVGFAVHRLRPGQRVTGRDIDREICLVFVSGTGKVAVNDLVFETVGGRRSPFDGSAPGAAYVPPGAAWSVESVDDAELAVCSAPGGTTSSPARQIPAEDMAQEVRGYGTNTRYVRNILPQDKPANALLVVEVVTPSGHWSSYPPHKHDTSVAGEETALEETYYHRLNPPQGFAVQRVYTDDRSLDEAVVVEDGDVVLVPRGYHPVGAPHGYALYYLNVMAGPERKWIFRNDPAHEWMLLPPS